MTVAEARQIIAAKPVFGARPDAGAIRQARALLRDWGRYKAMAAQSPTPWEVTAILRKHPSFVREDA